MVTSHGQTTIATMHSFWQWFLSPGVTVGAFLTRILGVYLDYSPTSVCSFVVKHVDEGRPPYIRNCFGKDSRRQTFDLEVFDSNHSEILYQPIRQLVLKILPLIGHVLVRFLQQQDGLTTTVWFLILASCYFTLSTTKFRLRCL
jgi:hypothetical protein